MHRVIMDNLGCFESMGGGRKWCALFFRNTIVVFHEICFNFLQNVCPGLDPEWAVRLLRLLLLLLLLLHLSVLSELKQVFTHDRFWNCGVGNCTIG